MYRVTTQLHFDSAHYLRGYDGPCSKMHGHRFTVRLYLSGEYLDCNGILVDFKGIKQVAKEIIDEFDHEILNDHPPFDTINPTAENIAWYFYSQLINPYSRFIEKVRVYESPDSYAEYFAKE